MFHVFKSRLFMTHAVQDCLKYVAIKGSCVQEFIRFSDFSRSHFTVSGQVIPTSQRGWRKWATGKTIPCLNNTMSKSRYKHPTAFEQFPCDIPLSNSDKPSKNCISCLLTCLILVVLKSRVLTTPGLPVS